MILNQLLRTGEENKELLRFIINNMDIDQNDKNLLIMKYCDSIFYVDICDKLNSKIYKIKSRLRMLTSNEIDLVKVKRDFKITQLIG